SINRLIGETPLLEITNFQLPQGVRLYAKLEFYNSGGSVKDRLGEILIAQALASGEVEEGGSMIEPTAGNSGMGLAMGVLNKNLSVILCVPEHLSQEKQIIMSALGATIVPTPCEEGMTGAIEKTKQLLGEIPNSYSPRQFSNPGN